MLLRKLTYQELSQQVGKDATENQEILNEAVSRFKIGTINFFDLRILIYSIPNGEQLLTNKTEIIHEAVLRYKAEKMKTRATTIARAYGRPLSCQSKA